MIIGILSQDFPENPIGILSRILSLILLECFQKDFRDPSRVSPETVSEIPFRFASGIPTLIPHEIYRHLCRNSSSIYWRIIPGIPFDNSPEDSFSLIVSSQNILKKKIPIFPNFPKLWHFFREFQEFFKGCLQGFLPEFLLRFSDSFLPWFYSAFFQDSFRDYFEDSAWTHAWIPSETFPVISSMILPWFPSEVYPNFDCLVKLFSGTRDSLRNLFWDFFKDSFRGSFRDSLRDFSWNMKELPSQTI